MFVWNILLSLAWLCSAGKARHAEPTMSSDRRSWYIHALFVGGIAQSRRSL
jgi:hypothetical protein